MDLELSPKAVSQQAELLKTSFQIVRRLERKVKWVSGGKKKIKHLLENKNVSWNTVAAMIKRRVDYFSSGTFSTRKKTMTNRQGWSHQQDEEKYQSPVVDRKMLFSLGTAAKWSVRGFVSWQLWLWGPGCWPWGRILFTWEWRHGATVPQISSSTSLGAKIILLALLRPWRSSVDRIRPICCESHPSATSLCNGPPPKFQSAICSAL